MRIQSIITIACLVLVAGCTDDSPDTNPIIGTSADFEVETLQSQNIKATLKQFQGKPVLIDFWATWCGPCRMLSPYVESIYQKYRDKGLQAMAISAESRADVQKFEANTPHRMPVYIDPYDVATNTLKVDSLPTIVVIDKTGKVAFECVGFPEGRIEDAANLIDKAVAKAL